MGVSRRLLILLIHVGVGILPTVLPSVQKPNIQSFFLHLFKCFFYQNQNPTQLNSMLYSSDPGSTMGPMWNPFAIMVPKNQAMPGLKKGHRQ